MASPVRAVRTDGPAELSPIVNLATFVIGRPAACMSELLASKGPRFRVVREADHFRFSPADIRLADVALFVDSEDLPDDRAAALVGEGFNALRQQRVGVCVLSRRSWVFAAQPTGIVTLPPDAPAAVVAGCLAALAQMRPVMRQIDLELTSMQHLGDRLARHFDVIDHELRLAARLQQDFLPRGPRDVGPLRFATLYRPCSCVSGDIFDIFRLDEGHVGFYLADAVGHGVAAGLLTMFIKNAIQTKRIRSDGYDIVPPAEVLSTLNDALASQCLPESQFVTAWYGLVNLDTLELTYSTAGHPSPLLVEPGGATRSLDGDGCLLGVFPEQTFATGRATLRPGQRLVLFSDGLEPVLLVYDRASPSHATPAPGVTPLLRTPAAEFIEAMVERLDNQPGGLSGQDDASMIVLDVAAALV